MRTGVEGPFQDFGNFTITIPKEKYALIGNRIFVPEAADDRYKWKFDPTVWPHLMYNEFLHQCPPKLKGCRISFKDHRFPKERHGKDYCVMRGKCTRVGSVNCEMKYTFYIRDDPILNQDVPVEVV